MQYINVRDKIMTDLQKTILTVYKQYTSAFQSAYEVFSADSSAVPNPSGALEFYHTPCLFISPFGIELYKERQDLEANFKQVMRDMQTKRYLRTDFGPINITFLGESYALLSVAIARYDLDEQRYDQYGCTYSFHYEKDLWKIAVVTTHSRSGVLIERAN